MSEPKKFDTDKPRYDLLPAKALGLLVGCLTYGAKKYDDYNWRKDGGIDSNRLFAATQRHLWAWKEGETNDKESGLPHLAHAATNLLMMLDLACRPPVKIPNFSPAPLVPELKPIQDWPHQKIDEATKLAGWPKKPVFEEGPMVVYPIDENTIKSTYAQLHSHRHDPKYFWAYDIVSDPEDVRFFSVDDGAGTELERLGVFTKVSVSTNAEGKERWTYSRTALGHAVKEYIRKEETEAEAKDELTPAEQVKQAIEAEAYYWLSRISTNSRAYKAAIQYEDVIKMYDDEDNRKFAESMSVLFESVYCKEDDTLLLHRTPSGHKIRSLLNAKS